MDFTLKSKWVVSEILLLPFWSSLKFWSSTTSLAYSKKKMRERLLSQTVVVKWREQGACILGGMLGLFCGPGSHFIKVEGGRLWAQVATSLPSVAAQEFSLKRRPGGPWGIREGNHVKVEMRQAWGINTKACVREGESSPECHLSRKLVTRPGREQSFSLNDSCKNLPYLFLNLQFCCIFKCAGEEN